LYDIWHLDGGAFNQWSETATTQEHLASKQLCAPTTVLSQALVALCHPVTEIQHPLKIFGNQRST